MEQGVVPNLTAEVFTEVITEIATEVNTEVATKILIIQFNRGVGNLIYHYIVVQAGSGFNVDTNAALYSTVAAEVAEVAAEVAKVAEVAAKVAEVASGLRISSGMQELPSKL